jgi:hypothetical protein
MNGQLCQSYTIVLLYCMYRDEDINHTPFNQGTQRFKV